MKNEAFNEFRDQIASILKDCMVTKATAESDSGKYWHHEMHLPINKGKVLYYDRSKVKSHTDELRQIISQMPQQNLRWG